MQQLDHLVLAAPDLDAAKLWFEELTGCVPVDGGRHVGLGTRNALVSFGEARYLELIGPDLEQTITGTGGERLAALDRPQLFHWAVRVNDLSQIAENARVLGLATGPVRATSRATPVGEMLNWSLMALTEHNLAGVLPFYIDWQDCPHPSRNAPIVGELLVCELTLADPVQRQLLAPVEGVQISSGSPAIKVTFSCPKGEASFQGSDLLGFRM